MKAKQIVMVVAVVVVATGALVAFFWAFASSFPRPLPKPVYTFEQYTRPATVQSLSPKKAVVLLDNGRKVSGSTDGVKFAVGQKVVARVTIEYVRYYADGPAVPRSSSWSIESSEGR